MTRYLLARFTHSGKISLYLSRRPEASSLTLPLPHYATPSLWLAQAAHLCCLRTHYCFGISLEKNLLHLLEGETDHLEFLNRSCKGESFLCSWLLALWSSYRPVYLVLWEEGWRCLPKEINSNLLFIDLNIDLWEKTGAYYVSNNFEALSFSLLNHKLKVLDKTYLDASNLKCTASWDK